MGGRTVLLLLCLVLFLPVGIRLRRTFIMVRLPPAHRFARRLRTASGVPFDATTSIPQMGASFPMVMTPVLQASTIGLGVTVLSITVKGVGADPTTGVKEESFPCGRGGIVRGVATGKALVVVGEEGGVGGHGIAVDGMGSGGGSEEMNDGGSTEDGAMGIPSSSSSSTSSITGHRGRAKAARPTVHRPPLVVPRIGAGGRASLSSRRLRAPRGVPFLLLLLSTPLSTGVDAPSRPIGYIVR